MNKTAAAAIITMDIPIILSSKVKYPRFFMAATVTRISFHNSTFTDRVVRCKSLPGRSTLNIKST
jgi:hypothetical protein